VLASGLKQRPEFRNARRLHRACRTAVEVADGLLRYAFTLDPAGDQATLNELKRILSGYLICYGTQGKPSETLLAGIRRGDPIDQVSP